MKALMLMNPKEAVRLEEVQIPTLKAGQVMVELKAAALNHRDVYITQGLYPGIKTPVILGSDGAGRVVKLGEGVDAKWMGASVIINPGIGWHDDPLVQPLDYRILGMPDNGCLAQYVAVNVQQIHLKPVHLSFEEAAALPLAGMTAYRALFSRGSIKASDKVLISGVGGGVALMAFQMAVAIGAKVYVTSSSDAKINKALAMGAVSGANYKNEQWPMDLIQQAIGGLDLIIDSAGGAGFKHFLDIAAFGGRIVFYGGTRGSFKVNPQKMFWKQLTMMGSTMGNNQEFKQMIELVDQYKIVPVVDSVWSMNEGNAAFEYMNDGKQFGKIVIQIES